MCRLYKRVKSGNALLGPTLPLLTNTSRLPLDKLEHKLRQGNTALIRAVSNFVLY